MSGRKRKVRQPSKADLILSGLSFLALSVILYEFEWPLFIDAISHVQLSAHYITHSVMSGSAVAMTYHAQYKSVLAFAQARMRF